MSDLWSAPAPSLERQEWSPTLDTVRLDNGVVASPWLRSAMPAVRGCAATPPLRPVPDRQTAWGVFRRRTWAYAGLYDRRHSRQALWTLRTGEDPTKQRLGEAFASPQLPEGDRALSVAIANSVFDTRGSTYANWGWGHGLIEAVTDYLVATHGLHEAIRILFEVLYENPTLDRLRDLIADLEDDAFETACLVVSDASDATLERLRARKASGGFAPDSQLETVRWAASYVVPVGSGAGSLATSLFHRAAAFLRKFGSSVPSTVVASGGLEGFERIVRVNVGAYHAASSYVGGVRPPLAALVAGYGSELLPMLLASTGRSAATWWQLLAHFDHPDALSLLLPEPEDDMRREARLVAAALHPDFRDATGLPDGAPPPPSARPLPEPCPPSAYRPPATSPTVPLPDGAPPVRCAFSGEEQATLDERFGRARKTVDEAWLAHRERWALPIDIDRLVDQTSSVVRRILKVGVRPGYGPAPWAAVRYAPEAMDAVAGFSTSVLLDIGGPLGDVRLYPTMAKAFAAKKHKDVAAAWLRRHSTHAAWAAVRDPSALGGRVLRYLATQGHREAIEAAATDADIEGIAAILQADPLTPKVRKKLKLPTWLRPAMLPALEGPDGPATPEQATEELLRFAVSNALEPHPALLSSPWSAESRADFVWALFESWLATGANAKEQWCLQALGFWGDDRVAQDLARLAARWPKEKAAKRAQWSLPALANIGSEVALAQIHALAETSRFPAFKEAARQHIDAIAQRMGLTPDALADRLVPRLDLDDEGDVLDFGPRQFTLRFDEMGQPYVVASDGKVRASLPKKAKSDDPALAKAATARFKVLKKATKLAAKVHIHRLEQIMLSQRQLPTETFRTHFQTHPWMTHLCQRLLWRSEDGTLFRVDEAGARVDADDEPVEPGAHVTLPHPTQLSDDERARWSQVWVDYELLPPFPQLNRPVAVASEAERASGRVKRFEGRPLPTAQLLGLKAKGWRWASGSHVGTIDRTLAGGCQLVLGLEPGFYPGNADEMDPQTVAEIRIVGDAGTIAWSEAITTVEGIVD